MERSIRGPDWPTDYGTAEQCAEFVGIDHHLWLELDAADLILPPAARRSRETARWHWHSAVYVNLCLVHLTARLREAVRERKKSSKKLGDTGAHSPPNRTPKTPEG